MEPATRSRVFAAIFTAPAIALLEEGVLEGGGGARPVLIGGTAGATVPFLALNRQWRRSPRRLASAFRCGRCSAAGACWLGRRSVNGGDSGAGSRGRLLVVGIPRDVGVRRAFPASLPDGA